MPLASAYHKPSSITDAQELLAGSNRVALAGGTVINADREHTGVEVVDLQALDLATISTDGDRMVVGAMVTLSNLAADDRLSDSLRSIVRAELPSTLRTRATVGGTVAAAATGAGAESVLAAALLIHGGQATFADGTSQGLAELYDDGLPTGALIISISIDPSGTTAVESTGRTPADTPIVATVARSADGVTTIAATGVAATPVLINAADPTANLEPVGDFRGSVEYRRHLAATLTRRVMESLS